MFWKKRREKKGRRKKGRKGTSDLMGNTEASAKESTTNVENVERVTTADRRKVPKVGKYFFFFVWEVICR